MLKKSLTLLFAISIFFSCWLVYSKPMFIDYSQEFESYSIDKSAGKIQSENIFSFLKNFSRFGEGVTLDREIVCSNDIDKDKIFCKFNAKSVFTSRCDEGISYYGYSKDIRYSEILNNQRVNLHVFVAKNGSVSIGSPIIYGSF